MGTGTSQSLMSHAFSHRSLGAGRIFSQAVRVEGVTITVADLLSESSPGAIHSGFTFGPMAASIRRELMARISHLVDVRW